MRDGLTRIDRAIRALGHPGLRVSVSAGAVPPRLKNPMKAIGDWRRCL